MDAIESMDWGAYAHFRFTGQQLPGILHVVQAVYVPGGYIVVAGVFFAVAVFILLLQERRRAAIVAFCSVLAAAGLLAATHFLVPRRRPPDAQNWLGLSGMQSSYPSDAVFLCLLSLVLLGAALGRSLPRPWQRGLYGLFAALATVWICVSELFLCVHFVTDLIGGIVGAAVIGWIACRLMIDTPAKPRRKTMNTII